MALVCLDAAKVAAALKDGMFTDDIRGFKNRLERWRPYKYVYENSKGQRHLLLVNLQKLNSGNELMVGKLFGPQWVGRQTECIVTLIVKLH